MPQLACPTPQQLSAFLAGRLPDSEFDEIARHLESCSACADAPDADPVPSDPLLAELSRLGAYAQEPQLAQALAALRQEHDHAASPAGDGPDVIREYRLLDRLGRGGMGTVYKAVHTRLDKVVALKLLPAERMGSAEARTRFEREMKAVGRCNHPHIVQAFDAGHVEGTFFLAMEFVDGIDLSRLVRTAGPLPVADACEIVRQAALGLEHVHRHGLVHRDIKPSNLMLSRDGLVKILDLGIARWQGEAAVMPKRGDADVDEFPTVSASGDDTATNLTAAGQVVGTASYMAPEQWQNTGGVDIRADLYSLGCTLHHLLAGRTPDAGDAGRDHAGRLERAQAVRGAALPSLGSLRTDVPPALDDVIARMTAESPDDRFASPDEVRAAIEPFTAGSSLPALARRISGGAFPLTILPSENSLPASPVLAPSPDARVVPADRRRLLIAGVVGAVVLSVVVATVVSLLNERRELREPAGIAVLQGAAAPAERSNPAALDASSPALEGRSAGPWHWQMETADRPAPVWTVAWSGDGSRIAIASGTGAEIRRAVTGEREAELSGPAHQVTIVAWNPAGDRIATAAADHRVRLWDGDGAAGPLLEGHTDLVTAVAWRPDGAILATAGADGTVRLWNSEGTPGTVLGTPAQASLALDRYIASLAWKPDGGSLAIGGNDGRVRLWPAAGGPAEVLASLESPIRSLAWIAGTRLAAAAGDKVCLWRITDTEPQPQTLTGHRGRVTSVAVAGGRIATAGEDGAVRVWTTSGESRLILEEHGGPITSLAWSPDETQLAVGVETGSAWLWNLAEAEPRLMLVLVPRAPPIRLSDAGRVRYDASVPGRSDLHYVLRAARGSIRVVGHGEFLRLIAETARSVAPANELIAP